MPPDATAPGALRAAVFFDRDGTLIDDEHYLADPAHVRLRPGAAAAVRRVTAAGMAAVVVTNQSGIGRGLLTEADYFRVRDHLDELLAAEGAQLDASYHCPHAPGGACDCRKPLPGLFRRAAEAFGLDLARSAAVGDRVRDLEAVAAAGGTGVLVASPDTPLGDVIRARREFAVASDLGAAIDRVLARRAAAAVGAP